MNTKPNHIDLSGRRFGLLTVIGFSGSIKRPDHGRRTFWRCRCKCGRVKTVLADNLRRGLTRSCGCQVGKNSIHGHASRGRLSAEYVSWEGMIARCHQNGVGLRYWGQMGVRVCARWRNSFPAFLKDMGAKPSAAHSIDRYPDPSGDYKPSNCRWATPKQQRASRRVP